MLTEAFLALISYPFLMLRLSKAEGSFPKPLSAEEEREYIDRCLEGDTEARNVLIERNLRLVAHIVKKYYSQSCEQDDLISIGTIGLIKGISSYRPDKGVRLATYASRCIENEILMHFRSVRKTASDVSLSDTLESDGDGGSLSLMDVVSVEDDILDRMGSSESLQRLRVHFAALPDEREREILTLRYGLSGEQPLTQKETAERLGISRSYVSRLEKKALERLKKQLQKEDFFD
ncbi:MAG: RNA polymerase sporulation sigma factor SigK [Oscillospiraceae bacterium]|nr:RNA polymerase sporulation sigma factor SigK [Oscillospiraceae bacterium]